MSTPAPGGQRPETPVSPRWRVPVWARMLARGERGRLGERLACRHLRRRGYKIIARNVRMSAGELDIVALRRPVLAVVEVRSRRPNAPASPEATVDRRKQAHIVRAADEWMMRIGRRRLGANVYIRFDIIAVEIDERWTVTRLEHFERAFDPPRNTPARR